MLRYIYGALAALIMLTIGASCTSTAPGGVLVIPLNPTAKSFGKNYAEWSTEWWKWALGLPVANHPLFDATGQNAAVGQTGNVWFLGSNFDGVPVTRTISVPAGTALFFPLINFEEDSAFAPDLSVDEMINEVEQMAGQVTSLTLIVDGVAMSDLFLLRARSPQAFAVQVPANDSIHDHFEVEAGESIATVVSDGYWAFIDPLPVGLHTIQFGGTQTNGGEVFTTSATYNVNVVATD